jgi:hypothetical protein
MKLLSGLSILTFLVSCGSKGDSKHQRFSCMPPPSKICKIGHYFGPESIVAK